MNLIGEIIICAIITVFIGICYIFSDKKIINILLMISLGLMPFIFVKIIYINDLLPPKNFSINKVELRSLDLNNIKYPYQVINYTDTIYMTKKQIIELKD